MNASMYLLLTDVCKLSSIKDLSQAVGLGSSALSLMADYSMWIGKLK